MSEIRYINENGEWGPHPLLATQEVKTMAEQMTEREAVEWCCKHGVKCEWQPTPQGDKPCIRAYADTSGITGDEWIVGPRPVLIDAITPANREWLASVGATFTFTDPYYVEIAAKVGRVDCSITWATVKSALEYLVGKTRAKFEAEAKEAAPTPTVEQALCSAGAVLKCDGKGVFDCGGYREYKPGDAVGHHNNHNLGETAAYFAAADPTNWLGENECEVKWCAEHVEIHLPDRRMWPMPNLKSAIRVVSEYAGIPTATTGELAEVEAVERRCGTCVNVEFGPGDCWACSLSLRNTRPERGQGCSEWELCPPDERVGPEQTPITAQPKAAPKPKRACWTCGYHGQPAFSMCRNSASRCYGDRMSPTNGCDDWTKPLPGCEPKPIPPQKPVCAHCNTPMGEGEADCPWCHDQEPSPIFTDPAPIVDPCRDDWRDYGKPLRELVPRELQAQTTETAADRACRVIQAGMRAEAERAGRLVPPQFERNDDGWCDVAVTPRDGVACYFTIVETPEEKRRRAIAREFPFKG